MTRPDVKKFRWSPDMDRTAEYRKGLTLEYRAEPLKKMLRRRITLKKALHTGNMSHEEFLHILNR